MTLSRGNRPTVSCEGASVALLITVFVIVFVGDMFSSLGLVREILPDLLEAVLLAILLAGAVLESKHSGRRFTMPGALPVITALVVYVVSALVNDQGPVYVVVFAQSVYTYYVLFLVLVNLKPSKRSLQKLNIVLLVLSVIQIPVALLRLLSEESVFLRGGDRSFGNEVAVGTFGTEGSMGTIFPLVAIGFLSGIYLWKHQRRYLALMTGFIFFSYLTGKRAFPIVLPCFVIVQYWLITPRRQGERFIIRRLVPISVVAIAGCVLGIALHPSLNPSHNVGGKVDIKFALSFVAEYETAEDEEGETTGRLGSTVLVLDTYAKQGIVRLLLGSGPGTLIKSGLVMSTAEERLDELGIGYGVTGIVFLFAQVGLLGVACYVWLYCTFVRQVVYVLRYGRDPYWKALAGGLIGMLLVILFDVVCYSCSSISGKVIPAIFFCVLAQMYCVAEARSRDCQWQKAIG